MIRKAQALCAVILFIAGGAVFSQTKRSGSLSLGVELYGQGRYAEAVSELRAVNPESADYLEAFYWKGLAELSSGDYQEALNTFELLERRRPNERRRAEIPYHKGRALFYLGRYQDALVVLSAHAEVQRDDDKRKAASLYWAGESLYALGRLDQAENVFVRIVEQYPGSAKHEASLYRMELIKQKKIEAELLSIIKWNHEESLKTLEDYQRRETAYEQAIAAYQKRLAELQGGDAFPADPELAGDDYEAQMRWANQRINDLDTSLKEANDALETLRSQPLSSAGMEKTIRLLSLKNETLSLRDAINEKLRKDTGK